MKRSEPYGKVDSLLPVFQERATRSADYECELYFILLVERATNLETVNLDNLDPFSLNSQGRVVSIAIGDGVVGMEDRFASCLVLESKGHFDD